MAVVGAGAFGSWIALQAVRAGFETILVDQYGPANDLSSSGGSSRIIRRAYGPDEIYTLLANRSLELWKGFLSAENRPDCFLRTGVLWMAREEESSIHEAREIFRRHSIGHQFLNVAEIRTLCRLMNVPTGTVALFEPDCGALLAGESVRAVAEAAVHSGARYVKGKVIPIASTANIKSLELENDGPIEADVCVFACGSWLPKLFADTLGHIIFPTRQEVFYFTSDAHWASSDGASLPIWVDQTDLRVPYGFPDIEGAGIKVAFHRTGPRFDPDTDSREINREQITEAADYLRSRFPSMGTPTFLGAQVCHYENTSSGDLLIDRHPSLRNVWFAGGGSGHGFKHAPAVAEYLLDAIQRDYSPEPRLRLDGKGTELAKRVV
jgi:glycine/D-amino acid oxidase-like deaminating enzyme